MPFNESLKIPLENPNPSYRFEPAFGGQIFDRPVQTVFEPEGGSDNAYVVEHSGRIWRLTDDGLSRTLFLDLSGVVRVEPRGRYGEVGLLGMAFHPRYAVNGKLFITYNTLLEPDNDATLVDRLSEFTISEVTDGVTTEFSERILISQPDQDLWHNAGMLLFGNDGYLYVGVGDEGGSGDPFENGQRIDGDFFSGILRIDVDNNPENLLPNPHPAIIGEYRIPADNPFVGVTGFNSQPVNQDGIRTEFFVVGLRNPWRFGYDQQTDTFFINDVGQGRVEEVNIGVPGANYGWSRLEGNLPFKGDSVGLSSYLPPLHHYGRDEGNSVTGGVFYRGDLYPELDGSYIYNDYGSGMFGVLRYHGSELKAKVEELLGDLEDLKGIPDDISIATEELESFRVSYLNSWTLQPDIRIDTASGSLYAPLGDGTWLLQGMAPWTDTVTVEFSPSTTGVIRAMQLDALPHPSLPGGGPGAYWENHAIPGEFILTDIAIEFQPDPRSEWTSVTLLQPYASFFRQGYHPSASIDTNPDSGWAIYDRFDEPHWARFPFADGQTAGPESRFRATLQFNHGVGAQIGRLGLHLSTFDYAGADGLPESVIPHISQPVDSWPEAARTELARLLHSIQSGSELPSVQRERIWNELGSLLANQNFSVEKPFQQPGVTSLGIDHSTGEILATTLGGLVLRLVRTTPEDPRPFEEQLSGVGFFTNMDDLSVTTEATEYFVNHPFWSDDATKRRWVVGLKPDLSFVPVGSRWQSVDAGIAFVKHFDMPTPTGPRRLETRFLVTQGNGVYGFTYRWNAEGTEAELVPPDGVTDTVSWPDLDGVMDPFTWRFPSQNECRICHNDQADGGILGFIPPQLNRNAADAEDLSQMAVFLDLGILSQPAGSETPSWPALDDSRFSLSHRVRAYWAVNCAYCHPGQAARSTWDARFDTPFELRGIIGVPPLEMLGIPDASIIAPGDPGRSIMVRRLDNLLPYHMPPLATYKVNHAAVDLLREWILNDAPSIVDGTSMPPHVELTARPEADSYRGDVTLVLSGYATDSDGPPPALFVYLNDQPIQSGFGPEFSFAISHDSFVDGENVLKLRVVDTDGVVREPFLLGFTWSRAHGNLVSIRMDADGSLRARLGVASLDGYSLEGSSDLKTWSPVEPEAVEDGVFILPVNEAAPTFFFRFIPPAE